MIFTRGVLSIPACDVYVRLQTTGAAIKIARGVVVVVVVNLLNLQPVALPI